MSDSRWVSAEGESASAAAMSKVRAAFREIDSHDQIDRRALPGCQGILAVTAKVVTAANDVNSAKHGFQAACAGLRGIVYSRLPNCNQPGRSIRTGLSVVLERIDRPNLNMFAAYRKVPILTGIPRRVGFSVNNAHTVYPTQRDAIVNRLRRRVDAESMDDLGRVQKLPEFETTLALLTNFRTYPYASVSFDGFNAQGRCHSGMLTGLPILYIAAGATPTVSYAPAKSGPPRKCSVREVCPDQYLKTMRVHRYYRYMNAQESQRSLADS
jgi:hypothetical protein